MPSLMIDIDAVNIATTRLIGMILAEEEELITAHRQHIDGALHDTIWRCAFCCRQLDFVYG